MFNEKKGFLFGFSGLRAPEREKRFKYWPVAVFALNLPPAFAPGSAARYLFSVANWPVMALNQITHPKIG